MAGGWQTNETEKSESVSKRIRMAKIVRIFLCFLDFFLYFCKRKYRFPPPPPRNGLPAVFSIYFHQNEPRLVCFIQSDSQRLGRK